MQHGHNRRRTLTASARRYRARHGDLVAAMDAAGSLPEGWLATTVHELTAAETAAELGRVVVTSIERLTPPATAVVAALGGERVSVLAASDDAPSVLLAVAQSPAAWTAGPAPLPSAHLGVLRHRGEMIGMIGAAAAADPVLAAAVVMLSALSGPMLGRLCAAARVETILAYASDVFTLCRTDGTVLYTSPSATQVLCTPPDRMVGRNILDLVPADTVDPAMAALRTPAGTRLPAFESTWRHSDGSVHRAETSTMNLVEDSAVGGILFATRDVTERTALQIELQHAQRLEAVGRLAAGIAHEINTPVQYVADNLHFLADAFGALLSVADPRSASAATGRGSSPPVDLQFLQAEVPQAVAQALSGLDRVARVVQAMRVLGHPDGGQLREVDLNRTLADAVTVANNNTRHVADVVCDFGEVPLVRCLAGDIGQVFLNLLVNAADAIAEVVERTGGRGRITLRTRKVGDDFVLAVTDTGSGIRSGVAEHVFDPFFTTKEVGRGTGQGLSLARAVAEQHGGTIGFTSAPGQGTTFTLAVPIGGPLPPVGQRDVARTVR